MFSHVTIWQSVSYLVDAKKAGRDRVKREVLFENVLIDGVHALLDASHVVPQIPHVDLVIKLKPILLTLYGNTHPAQSYMQTGGSENQQFFSTKTLDQQMHQMVN